MSEVFISYAHSTEPQAHQVEQALRALGYGVWRDNALPAHRAFSEVLEDKLREAKAVVVLWSAEAVKSDWVRAEANRARETRKLVQLSIDGAALPLPFDQTQCADMNGWSGEVDAPGWLKVLASVADLVGEPRATGSAQTVALTLPTRPSIAVLPFTNLSGDADQDYFADGMVEEIVAALTRFRSLFVIASGSSLSFKGAGIGYQEAARSLGVRYALEGSVRRSANRVRIAVKLSDAVEGRQIWADRFEGTLEDVFALQDRVALSAAGAIWPTIEAVEERKAADRPTQDMNSYELFLRARVRAMRITKADALGAITLLDRAIELDPNYALAMAQAAICHSQMVALDWAEDGVPHRDHARRLIGRALALSADDAEVLQFSAAALVNLREDDDTARALVERSLALNPGNSVALLLSGHIQQRLGKASVAIEQIERAMLIDPRSPYRPIQLWILGEALMNSRRFADAVAALNESVLLNADFSVNYALLAACYGHLGQIEAARQSLAKLQAITGVADPRLGRWSTPAEIFLEGIALAEGSGKAAAH
ncbi:MAG TPA: TIR domain-containing protein [Caulobacteraceae bacterium]|jgi:adenylate cyclase